MLIFDGDSAVEFIVLSGLVRICMLLIVTVDPKVESNGRRLSEGPFDCDDVIL